MWPFFTINNSFGPTEKVIFIGLTRRKEMKLGNSELLQPSNFVRKISNPDPDFIEKVTFAFYINPLKKTSFAILNQSND